jgi:hypothetical protein
VEFSSVNGAREGYSLNFLGPVGVVVYAVAFDCYCVDRANGEGVAVVVGG